MDAGASRMTVATGFWQSAEHRGIEVTSFYETYLHRAPDANGKQGWVNFFLAGAGEEMVTLGFLTSSEYLAANPVPNAYVSALYRDVLGRTPDPNGFASWVQALQLGAGTRAVASGFLYSPENIKNAVDNLYLTLLQRPAEEGGLEVWSHALASGIPYSSVAESILASDEFYQMF
jgi:hypothetical protein